MKKELRYVIMKSDYDENGHFEQCWFLIKNNNVIGWTTDENYCATKFSYKKALLELENIKKTCGYASPNFFKSEITIEQHYA